MRSCDDVPISVYGYTHEGTAIGMYLQMSRCDNQLKKIFIRDVITRI